MAGVIHVSSAAGRSAQPATTSSNAASIVTRKAPRRSRRASDRETCTPSGGSTARGSGDLQRSSMSAAPTNKVDTFIANWIIRDMLCQQDRTLNFFDELERGARSEERRV